MNCVGAQSAGGGGGGTTIINNYTNYLNAPINRTNLIAYPFISEHFVLSGSPTYVSNHLTGTFTLTAKEDSVFNNSEFTNRTGSNSMVFKNSAGGTIKTVSINVDSYSDTVIFRSIEFTLPNAELVDLTWQTVPAYTTRNFTEVGTIIDMYPIKWYNAVGDGTKLTAAGGNIVAAGYVPFVVYDLVFTGTAICYDKNGNLLYSDSIFNYPNPIWRLEVTGTVTAISYFASYSEPETFVTYGPAETFLYRYNAGTFTFNQPTFVKNVVASGSGTIVADGISYSSGSFNKLMLIESTLVGSLIVSIDCQKIAHFEQETAGFSTLDFSSFANGTIYIENDYLLVESGDQLNNPAMVNSGTVLYSADGNSLVPTAATGVLNVSFKQATYVKTINFSPGSTGTLTIGGKTYPIADSVETRDFVNSGCFACFGFSVLITGGLVSINAATTLPSFYERDSQNYVVEDFATKSVEFTSTIFNTNVASALGTPNTAFGGPGVGAGGGPGNGANAVYLGNATTSNIVFDTERWVQSISLINCVAGNKLDLNSNAGLIKSFYVGNFGANSVQTLNIKKKLKSIVLTGTMAISSIVYGAPNRIVVGLPDNAGTPAAIGGLSGNYIIKVVGGSTAIINATNSGAGAGTVVMQTSASATGESIYAQWLSGQPLQIYHFTTKTGGTGALLYYVIYYI